MTERNAIIAIVAVLVIGAGVVGLYSKWSENLNLTATPAPSPSGQGLLFNGTTEGTVPNAQPLNSAVPQTMRKTYSKFPGILSADQLANKKAVIQTSKGTIEFEIYPEAPKAASNFMLLASDHFYDGLTFHRVVPGFVIQGGDPKGDGTGGPGYQFEDETVTKNYDKGIVAMANAGPNTNGSQFFIMLADNPSLPKSYTIFGKVTTGQEVVDKIAVGDVMTKVSIEPLK